MKNVTAQVICAIIFLRNVAFPRETGSNYERGLSKQEKRENEIGSLIMISASL